MIHEAMVTPRSTRATAVVKRELPATKFSVPSIGSTIHTGRSLCTLPKWLAAATASWPITTDLQHAHQFVREPRLGASVSHGDEGAGVR